MDIDLADYDQMDEAKYFIGNQQQQQQQQQVLAAAGCDLLTTLSSERASSTELANCENDFVFLPAPGNTNASANSSRTANTNNQQQQQDKKSSSTQMPKVVITPDQLDIRSHVPAGVIATLQYALQQPAPGESARYGGAARVPARARPNLPVEKLTEITRLLASASAPMDRLRSSAALSTQQSRLAHPLTSLNATNNTNAPTNAYHTNPFFSSAGSQQANAPSSRGTGGSSSSSSGPQSTASAAASVVTSQPFWMRTETFANQPVGLLEPSLTTTTTSATASSSSSSHLSDLMHQIVTKSDSIFIAIPCPLCQDSKACPPSDISAWLSHMSRAHNCKLCPICNKLVGLGPMRDIEIMRRHVVAHIDDEWLERRSAKTNFTFGLQQQWFSSGRCTVKDPRALNK